MRFDNLDVGARCSGKSDQLVALVIVELRAGVEQEEVDLPVVECLAGRLQTGHAWRLIQSDSRPGTTSHPPGLDRGRPVWAPARNLHTCLQSDGRI